MTLSETLEIAARMVGYYPNGGGSANKTYIAGLAAALGAFPRRVAVKAADPVNGVPRACKFLPTPADIIEWCEREAAPMYEEQTRLLRIEQQLDERATEQGIEAAKALRSKAQEWLSREDPKARQLLSSEPWRIKGAMWDADENRKAREMRAAEIEAEWDRMGQEPPRVGKVAISPQLAAILAEKKEDVA